MTRPPRWRRDRQAAFTLVELMVVLAILGLLSTAVVVYMRPQRSALDCANVVADVLREASRKAVSLGPVPSDVVNNLGVTQRTRVIINGDFIQLSELRQVGQTANANWVQIRSVRVILPDRQVTMTGWKPAAQVNDGASGSPPAIDANLANLLIHCKPDGSCDAGTIYFAGPNATTARTVILPLGGATMVRRGL